MRATTVSLARPARTLLALALATGCAPWPETQRDASLGDAAVAQDVGDSGDAPMADAADVAMVDAAVDAQVDAAVDATDVAMVDAADVAMEDSADAADVAQVDAAADAQVDAAVVVSDAGGVDDRPAPPPDTGVFGLSLRGAGFVTNGPSTGSGTMVIRQQGFLSAARRCGREGAVEYCWTGGFLP